MTNRSLEEIEFAAREAGLIGRIGVGGMVEFAGPYGSLSENIDNSKGAVTVHAWAQEAQFLAALKIRLAKTCSFVETRPPNPERFEVVGRIPMRSARKAALVLAGKWKRK